MGPRRPASGLQLSYALRTTTGRLWFLQSYSASAPRRHTALSLFHNAADRQSGLTKKAMPDSPKLIFSLNPPLSLASCSSCRPWQAGALSRTTKAADPVQNAKGPSCFFPGLLHSRDLASSILSVTG
jgi:hypothetical protein